MYDDPLWRSIIYHKQWSQQQTIAKLYLWLKQYTWIQHINAYKLFISLFYSYKKIINQTADCKRLRSRASISLSSVRNVRHHNAKTAQLSCHLRTILTRISKLKEIGSLMKSIVYIDDEFFISISFRHLDILWKFKLKYINACWFSGYLK